MKSTITSSTEISSFFSQGKRFNTPFVTVLTLKGDETRDHGRHGRVAFIAGKKLGGAVWRNAAKRRMRAVVCDLGGPWPGVDVVFLARGSILKPSYSKVCDACEKALKKAGIVADASR